MITVIENTSLKSADDTGQNTHVQGFVNGLEGRGQNQITDSTGQTCRTVVVLSQTHTDTDRKDKRQIIKDRSTGLGDKRYIQHIRRT